MTNRHHRRRSNPRVVVRYRNRHHRRYRNRGRRNPGFLSGDMARVAAILGGAVVTSLLVGMIPAQYTSGMMGMVATGIVAVVAGTVAGKVMRNPSIGRMVAVGGLLIVGLNVLQMLVPNLQLPFTTTSGTAGMGLISSSNFYVPQVNLPGSMASFVLPAAIPGPVVATPSGTMNGLGSYRTVRRLGRFR
jgi:hypothetical protein